jgi:hypothetical protein
MADSVYKVVRRTCCADQTPLAEMLVPQALVPAD